MKRASASIFAAIVFSFSAVLIILSLFASIRLAALDDSAQRLGRDIAAAEKRRQELSAEYESAVSLDALERYATEVLGMRRPSGAQIEYIELKK